MKKIILLIAISLKLSTAHPTAGKIDNETDGEKSRKIIGQSVVTSVSVVMNGNEEPQFTDAVGKTVPRPFIVPPHVASPINLLNPDRYEFYTFNDKGELVKRLMTLSEIQSIVANGNGALISDNDPHESQSVVLNTIPLTNHGNSDTKVQDIVDNVQNVLSREMENNKNLSSIPQDLLDTPNVSSTWSMILPAIFGNTGDEILPHRPINMTPETEVIDTTTTKRRVSSTRRPTTKVPVPKTTAVPQRQTTKVEQKITQSSTMKNQKKPSSSTMTTSTTTTTKKQQTVKQKPKPTSTVYRSTTRRPIVPITSSDLPSIKENHADESTKTVLITSRPYTSTSTTQTTSTRRPTISTTLKAVTSTTRKTLKKPSVAPITIINKVPVSALVKDSVITMIEMKPITVESKTESSENESKNVEKATVLSTRMPSTSQKPSMTPLRVTETKAPSSSSSTVLITTPHPISTALHKTSTILLSPVKLETFTTRKPVPATTKLTTMMREEEKKTTTSTVAAPSQSQASDEIQDLAISQIIGSLQNDNFNLNHLFKPPYDEDKPITTTLTPIEENDEAVTTTEASLEKSAEDINLVPDRVFINNQLYIDEKDPIVMDIPTTTEVPSSSEESDDTTTIESDTIAEEEEEIMSTTKKEDLSLENSEVMQAIEQLLRDQHKSKNKLPLEKLDVLGFDEDDETEIKVASTLNSKKNLTQSEFNTKAATVASFINTKFIEKPLTTTEMPISEESDTTIPTILSEALSSVIQQMLREQELRRVPSTIATERLKPTMPPTTPTTMATTTTTTTTVKEEETTASKTPEATEPSLDDLNKLLHHYQELGSKRDELESFSLLSESATEAAESEEEITTAALAEETQPIIIEEKSSVQSSKIFSEIDTTTTPQPLETTTAEEFTTFFYVSDDNSVEEEQNFGSFTTEQYVVTEKRISERKTEDFATTNPPSSSEEEDEDAVQSPGELVSSVLNAIGITNSEEEEEDDEEEVEEESTNASTETYEDATGKDSQTVTDKGNNASESDESDEVVNAISSISSTLDRTLTTDIKTDFSLTSKIADSLISVADSISATFNGGESDESTDKVTTVIPQKEIDEKEKFLVASEEEEEVTEAVTEPSTVIDLTTLKSGEDEATTIAIKRIRPRLPAKLHKQNVPVEKDSSSPMIQLSIIRKEDSMEPLEMMMMMTTTSTPTEETNYVKIESIDMSSTTTAPGPKLSGLKIKTLPQQDSSQEPHIKPIYISKLSSSTTKTSATEVEEKVEEELQNDESTEVVTERVPLIEKATKETVATSSSSSSLKPLAPTTSEQPTVMMASDENLVQIEVQTKTPAVDNKIITTTLSNVQNIKNTIKISQQHQQMRPAMPIDLSSSSQETLGLAASTAHLSSDLRDFSKLCNDLAFTFWKSITADGISQSRSVVISPFALTSTLAMIFLGARGQTSGEMNDLLKLDDTISFNPHVVFRNISESVEQSRNSGIAAAAFARELYSDRSKGKLLPYFKEKAQQFYGAHVEEVNFNVINDILRRRTNLLVKRHTYNKIKEYLKTNNIWVNEPLAAVSANVFMTDCSKTTNSERDGEMFFQVSPAIRQRRLVPIPAAVYRSGFTAGYDPTLDATAVAFGDELQSTILVMPGQQGSLLPGDNLERLESAFLESNDAWERLLTTFMERPGLEVQIPRFSHRSLINTTFALQQMGLKDIFNANKADLRGLTGSTNSDLYFSDLLQINQFTTCGEDKIGDSHHIEIYPSPALKKGFVSEEEEAKLEMASGETNNMQYKSLFYDPIYDSRYMNVPLSLRPRQARLPENPRLRFDRPFLYFVRHNPTNIILFMGRFNPRLLP